MFKDRDNTPVAVGDSVLRDGYLYVIRDFIVYEMAVEVVCEEKTLPSHQIKLFQLRDIKKI